VGTAAGAAAAFSVLGAVDPCVLASGVAVGEATTPAGARLPFPAADGSSAVAGVHDPVGSPPFTVRFTAPGANAGA